MPVDDEAIQQEKLDAVEAGLARTRATLRLRPELEQEFLNRTDDKRKRAIWNWHVAAILMNVGCLPLDYSAGLLEAGLWLRLGIVTPVYLLALFAMRGRTPLLDAAAVVAPLIMLVTAVAVLSQMAVAPHTDRYLMAAGLLILFVNIAVPLRFSHAWMATTGSLAALAAIVLVMSQVSEDTVALCSFIVVISLVSLVVRFRSERASRNAFLITLRDEIKSVRLLALTEALAHLAETDPLTGLFNRRHLTETLRDKWQEAREKSDWFGVLMIDIDHFKRFNDTAGHEEGDRCLKAIAGALNRETVASGQYLARFGGEEFLAVLSGLEPDPVMEQAEKLRRCVEEMSVPHPGLGAGGLVTVSIGASVLIPSRQLSVTDLVVAADKALYEAKATGRNKVASAAVVRLPARRREDRTSAPEPGGEPWPEKYDGLDRTRQSGT